MTTYSSVRSPRPGRMAATLVPLSSLRSRVRVTAVCPALTDTPFFDSVEGGSVHKKTAMARWRGMTRPETVARKIVASIGKHRAELVFTAGGRLLTIISALWPRLADRMMKVYHDQQLRAMRQG